MVVQLHQLAYFVAVAGERHFTRSAARVRVAQPSISRQIRLLERELAVQLFHRSTRHAGVELTAEGAALLPWAERVLADVEATRVEARSLVELETGRLTLGATPSLSTSLLPEVLVRFHRAYPGVELGVVEAGSRVLVPRVAAGELDLAFVVLPVDTPELQPTELFTEALVLAVGSAHPLAHRDTVRVADLDQVPLVMFREGYDLREATVDACAAAGVEPVLSCEGGEMDCVLALVKAGLGAAVVPELAAGTAGVSTVSFVDPLLHRRIGLEHHRDRPLPRAAHAFAALVGHGQG